MSRYSSTKTCTSNEAGKYEVELTYSNGLIRDLFNLPEKREVYIGEGGTVWYDKFTGERAGTLKEHEICGVVGYHKYINLIT